MVSALCVLVCLAISAHCVAGDADLLAAMSGATASADLKTIGNYTTLQLGDGMVRGSTTHGGHVRRFLGVPYAEPPVGELRWQPPVPKQSWTGTRAAWTYSASCVQGDNAFTLFTPVDEDCLYLNLWLPASPSPAPRPAMIFFYGGSDDTGSAMFPLYSGGNLVAESNDTVVVAVNYRLNVFGWLGSDQLRGRDNSTGNFGLQDQRASIVWLRKNAAALNVDVNRITIFGESAGAAGVSSHLVALRSRGLFSGAIAESGPFAPWTSQSLAQADARFQALAKNLACTDSAAVAQCLRSKTTAEVKAANNNKLPKGGLVDWSAVVDGVEFEDEIQYMAQVPGRLSPDVAVMLGTNRDEGTTFTKLAKKNATHAQFVQWMTSQIPNMSTALTSEISSLYPTADFTPTPFADATWWAASAITGDYAMSCPARRSAHALAVAGAPVYLYFFDEKLLLVDAIEAASKAPYGVGHGCELVLVFGIDELLLEPREKALAKATRRFWLNFAAHRNPNGASGAAAATGVWPRFETVHNSTLQLRTPLEEVRGLKKVRCNFWDSFFARGR